MRQSRSSEIIFTSSNQNFILNAIVDDSGVSRLRIEYEDNVLNTHLRLALISSEVINSKEKYSDIRYYTLDSSKLSYRISQLDILKDLFEELSDFARRVAKYICEEWNK